MAKNSAIAIMEDGQCKAAQRPTSAPVTAPLGEAHTAEVLRFLDSRPLDTIFLSGLIRDNGIVSPLNRGNFYGCRDEYGDLVGVALVGHATLIEARTPAALRSFATVTQNCRSANMILGKSDVIERFWHYYGDGGRTPRLLCRELLFERKGPTAILEHVLGLRPAVEADIDLILPIHAQLAFDESGVDPLKRDPDGFRLRCARRIRQGRIWVVVEDGRLVFKADIVTESPEVTYLEGVYASPEMRGRGFGLRCFTQLCRQLLTRSGSVRLLVNEQNTRAISFYERAGFKLQGFYDTVFLQQEA
jgi:predicted GNAT family acetyltransferase